MPKTKNHFKKIFLLATILAVFGLGVFAFSSEAQAASRMVDDMGIDSGNCIVSACRTITYAYSQAVAGDTVNVAAGTYSAGAIITKDSITIQGTVDIHGNPLSIIDPYIDISGGWTHTSNGVYTKNIGYEIGALVVYKADTGKKYKIHRLCQTHDHPAAPSYCNKWNNALQMPDTKTYLGYGGNTLIATRFWDGVEAVFTCEISGQCYVSFGNDLDVSQMTLYGTKIKDNNLVPTLSDSLFIVNADNFTVKNFVFKVPDNGFYIWQGSNNITIDNNRFYNGRHNIYWLGGGDITVTNNIFEHQTYGGSYVGIYKPGSWATNNPTYDITVMANIYGFVKYWCGFGSNPWDDVGIQQNGGTGHAIVRNNKFYGYDSAFSSNGTGSFTIENNIIKDSASTCIVFSSESGGYGGGVSSINNNELYNCNSIIRPHYWQGSGTSGGSWNNNTQVYIYNNRIWQPPDVGTGIFFHNNIYGGGTMSKAGIAWIYHNSFSGGYNAFQVNSGQLYTNNVTSGVRLVNNIISADTIWGYGSNDSISVPGFCSYNWLAGLSQNKCNGLGNINSIAQMPGWESLTPHNFTLPMSGTGSSARDSGVDISQNNWYNSYAALAGFDHGYAGPDWKPDMGVVIDNQTDVNSDTFINIKDIQACIKVITGSDMTYENQCRVLATPTDKINIKDIQVIIRAIIGG